MKKILRRIAINLIGITISNYIVFLFVGILLFPILVFWCGTIRTVEYYFEEKCLSYANYKKTKENITNIIEMNKK